MSKCNPLVNYIADVPDTFMQLLRVESSLITTETVAESSRVFFKSRACSYNVSRYSDQQFSRPLTPNVENILKWILDFYPDHTVFWATILSMVPGQRYPVHSDGKKFHFYSKRLHIPITYPTNSYHIHFIKTDNKWNEVKSTMEEGKMYEFDNIVPHSAINNSTEMRHVFVVDLIPTELFLAHTDWLDTKIDTAILTSKVDLEFSKDPHLKYWTYNEIRENGQF